MEKVNYDNFDMFNMFKTENIPNSKAHVTIKTSSMSINLIRREKITKIWNKKPRLILGFLFLVFF